MALISFVPLEKISILKALQGRLASALRVVDQKVKHGGQAPGLEHLQSVKYFFRL